MPEDKKLKVLHHEDRNLNSNLADAILSQSDISSVVKNLDDIILFMNYRVPKFFNKLINESIVETEYTEKILELDFA